MNRYVTEGIAADLSAGKKVGILSTKRITGAQAFREVVRKFAVEIETASLANGNERVELKSGGSLRLLPGGDLSREWPMDVLVILDWNSASPDITSLVDETWRRNGISEIIRF